MLPTAWSANPAAAVAGPSCRPARAQPEMPLDLRPFPAPDEAEASGAPALPDPWAVAPAGPHLEGDDEVVEREREGEKRARDEAGLHVRHHHVAEDLELARAEVARAFGKRALAFPSAAVGLGCLKP